jgi:hypothetical protein
MGFFYLMRESIIIYRSFYDAIKELEPTHQAEVWRAVFEYGLNKNEVDLSGLPSIIFKLIKPQLDANIRKYENGTKGGRPKKQSETKEKPKNNLNETKAEPNVNDNENDNKNDNHNTNYNNDFIGVWSLYGKVGNKTTSMAKYNRLTKKEKQAIEEHIPLYIKNHVDNDKQDFIPHFTTYLNQRRWEDDLPYKSKEIPLPSKKYNIATLDD